MTNQTIVITTAALLVSVLGMASASTVMAQTSTSTSVSGSFANVQTVQDSQHIVITITKSGEAPTGPIIVQPEPAPEEEDTGVPTDENATDTEDVGVIVIPIPENVTDDETANEVVIIDSEGNVTQVEDAQVIPNEDNSTIVVTEENTNGTTVVTTLENETSVIESDSTTVTETGGGVIVVDPPECGCPVDEITTEEEPAAPVVDEGGVITDENATDTVPAEEPMPFPEPTEDTNATEIANDSSDDTLAPSSFLASLGLAQQ